MYTFCKIETLYEDRLHFTHESQRNIFKWQILQSICCKRLKTVVYFSKCIWVSGSRAKLCLSDCLFSLTRASNCEHRRSSQIGPPTPASDCWITFNLRQRGRLYTLTFLFIYRSPGHPRELGTPGERVWVPREHFSFGLPASTSCNDNKIQHYRRTNTRHSPRSLYLMSFKCE